MVSMNGLKIRFDWMAFGAVVCMAVPTLTAAETVVGSMFQRLWLPNRSILLWWKRRLPEASWFEFAFLCQLFVA